MFTSFNKQKLRRFDICLTIQPFTNISLNTTVMCLTQKYRAHTVLQQTYQRNLQFDRRTDRQKEEQTI